MKTIASTLAAALLASASFAGAALADGDYYDGVSKDRAALVDAAQTGSIRDGLSLGAQQFAQNDVASTVDNGDYYQGANRPE